jgi:rRNA-processing protein FCF1
MNEYIIKLIQKYRNVGVLLDTNILLLYFVGSVDPKMIATFKRTHNKGFTETDFYTLVSLLKQFKKAITTPNILTEVSNFLGQLPDHLYQDYFEWFANAISTLDEHYLTSSELAHTYEFGQFGLTDSGIIQLAKDKFLIITEDFRLSQYSQKIGIDTLNFNHIRTLG